VDTIVAPKAEFIDNGFPVRYSRDMRLSGRKPSSFTRRWTQRPRVILLGLLGVNVVAFVAQLFLDAYQPGFVREYLGLSDRGVHAAYGWQFLTAIFLHDGPWHLLGNMLILYLLGRDVESIIGQRQFLFLYLAGAAAGELGHLFLMPATSVLFAASGGVAAVLVAYATILPELELTSMILLLLPVRVKAKYLAYGAFAIAIWGVTLGRSGAVAYSAYLGGIVAGWFYAHLLGFGRASILQRALRQRRVEAERYRAMTPDQFISKEVDPILDKISREGLQSLTWTERRTLARAQEKIAERAQAG
jgi:membrane associated rhomboid family serine protease